MVIWFSLIIPIISVLVMYFAFKREIAWWEYILPVIITAIFIVGVKAMGEFSMTKTTEYWGGYVTQATYYEPWDEEVPCRHPIYRTETYDCGTSKSPATCSRQVYVGNKHAYDVDDHGPEWTLDENNGFTLNVSEEKYVQIVATFGNKHFVDMHRNYHSYDGDAYVTNYPNIYKAVIPVTTTHLYSNRVKCSSSVFNYRSVEDKDQAGLYDYMENGYFDTPSVFPRGVAGSDDVDKINALLGKKKQVRVMMLVYIDQDREIAQRQEAYWKNGNMNELVICVGVDKSSNIKWAEVFSWTKSEELKISLRDYLQSQKKLDIHAFAPYLHKQVDSLWVRRDFKEFDYLQVDQPLWAIITAYVLAILISAGCTFFAISNDSRMEDVI